MLSEYNPRVADDYDLFYFYRGELGDWAKSHEYSVKNFIEGNFTGNHVGSGMQYVHEKISKKYEKVCIVGSDIVFLDKSRILECFQELTVHDVVIVPVEDGGYGLIGSKGYIDVYTSITNWASRSEGYDLYNQTLTLLKLMDKSVYSYKKLLDIDYVQDIQKVYSIITENDLLKNEYIYLSHTYNILHSNKEIFGL